MKNLAVVALFSLLCGCATHVSTVSPTRDMIVTPIEQAKFTLVDPASPNGPQVAILHGDPATGPSTMLMRLKKGGGTPHLHSSDYQLVVLQGTMKHYGKGQAATAPSLNPGSYWFQPGGQVHSDPCLTDECLLFIVWSGKRDGRLPVEGDR